MTKLEEVQQRIALLSGSFKLRARQYRPLAPSKRCKHGHTAAEPCPRKCHVAKYRSLQLDLFEERKR